MLWVELAGVLTVGTLSLVVPDWFPDATVWSDFGIGYGFVPVALPVAGLLWLRAQDPERARSRRVTAFRVVAFAEALSWLGLLTGMFFKYVVDAGEQGVQVFGPIHGTVFLTYLVVTLLTWRSQRWSLPVALLALAASVPPFCTVALRGVGASGPAGSKWAADGSGAPPLGDDTTVGVTNGLRSRRRGR